MIVRKYEEKDFDQIKQWASQWGSEYVEDQLPNTGFIVDGVAAYFLYATDSNVCWLENMISDRHVDKFIRARALDLLVEALLKEAKDMGFTVAYATTDRHSIAKRAKENGASVKPLQFLIRKDLTQNAQIQ